MNEWEEAQAYLNGSMSIEFDGQSIPVQVYLDRAERAERLARKVQGSLYDTLREPLNVMEGVGRAKRPRSSRSYKGYANRVARLRAYADQMANEGRIEYVPTSASHIENAARFLELFEKFFPEA